MRVAVLGAGSMGGAMVRRLTSSGFETMVWNRTPSRAERLCDETGALWAASPAEAAVSDVVITTLADRVAVESVFLQQGGLLDGSRSGLVVCEMSTVEPQVSQQLAPQVRERGGDLIDAPVSGSVALVEQGGLTIMAGGRSASIDRARPVLAALSTRIFELGPVGTGAAMKLAVNTVVHGINQALSEALVMAEAAGVRRALAYDVFESSAAGAPFVKYKRAAFEDPDGAPVAFRLRLVQKDLELILDFARSLGVEATQAEANLAVVNAAVATFAERDMSALAEYLRRARDGTPNDAGAEGPDQG
jgi:3-hydroxyisobutyrate dehydrogenase-like beta-hydroxyacid dehydrogenase